MVRGGGPAEGTVVVDCVLRVVFGEIQHVGEVMPDALPYVAVPGYDQMVRKDRKWIDLDPVTSALPSVELEMILLRRPVFRTKEAWTRFQTSFVNFCSGGTDPAWVVL